MKTTSYPNSPGFKTEAVETSKDAAAVAEKRDDRVRRIALEEIKRRPQTADEVAAALGESILYVRPRIAQLHALGKIKPTEERRANEVSSLSAVVWTVGDGVPKAKVKPCGSVEKELTYGRSQLKSDGPAGTPIRKRFVFELRPDIGLVVTRPDEPSVPARVLTFEQLAGIDKAQADLFI